MPDIPPISEQEIYDICRQLKLPEKAFHGEDGTDPRQEVIKSMETLDIEACLGRPQFSWTVN